MDILVLFRFDYPIIGPEFNFIDPLVRLKSFTNKVSSWSLKCSMADKSIPLNMLATDGLTSFFWFNDYLTCDSRYCISLKMAWVSSSLLMPTLLNLFLLSLLRTLINLVSILSSKPSSDTVLSMVSLNYLALLLIYSSCSLTFFSMFFIYDLILSIYFILFSAVEFEMLAKILRISQYFFWRSSVKLSNLLSSPLNDLKSFPCSTSLNSWPNVYINLSILSLNLSLTLIKHPRISCFHFLMMSRFFEFDLTASAVRSLILSKSSISFL